MIGAKLIGFMLISSFSGLAYLKYSQFRNFQSQVTDLEKSGQLRNFLFQSCENSSYFIDRLMDNFQMQYNQSNINKYKNTLLKLAEGKILETCAGSNRSLKFYEPGSDVTLLDWSPKMASVGITRSLPTVNSSYIVGDATKIPFEDNSFDTVVDIFGLQYTMQPQKVLSQMRRVCKKDGTILLMNQGLSQIVEFHYWENAKSAQNLIHMGIFTNRNWDKIVQQFDFKQQHLERKKNGKIYIQVLKNRKQNEKNKQD